MPLPEDLICRCRFVRETDIEEAVATNKLTTVDEVSEATEAGSRCGGCRPEIAEIVSRVSGVEVDPYE
jgi:NAD(P)H-nitrite reductase large subunit